MSIQDKIQDAAARNASLQHTLHETDSAIPDLESQQRYVADLERQVADAAGRLEQLGGRRERERKEHESYRDSVMKRFAYKVGGRKEKFEARAAKEEREYFDVLQEEHQAGVTKKNLDDMLEDARRIRGELEGSVAVHERAQKELNGLYESIFNGPSPGFPEEDERERDLQMVVVAYHEARSRAEAEAQAVSLLSKAQGNLKAALQSMEEALRASRRDVMGGGTFHDMMERNALSRADSFTQQARSMVSLAQQSSPFVRTLPPVSIAQGSMLGDVFFDNIYSDMAFHDKIHQSNLEMHRCTQALSVDLDSAKQRHMEMTRDAELKGAAMRKARMKLQKTREVAFERIAGPAGLSSVADIPPPSYTADDAADNNWWET